MDTNNLLNISYEENPLLGLQEPRYLRDTEPYQRQLDYILSKLMPNAVVFGPIPQETFVSLKDEYQRIVISLPQHLPPRQRHQLHHNSSWYSFDELSYEENTDENIYYITEIIYLICEWYSCYFYHTTSGYWETLGQEDGLSFQAGKEDPIPSRIYSYIKMDDSVSLSVNLYRQIRFMESRKVPLQLSKWWLSSRYFWVNRVMKEVNEYNIRKVERMEYVNNMLNDYVCRDVRNIIVRFLW